jgi:hypothetical protein
LGASLSLLAHSYLKTFPDKPINFRRAKKGNYLCTKEQITCKKVHICEKQSNAIANC